MWFLPVGVSKRKICRAVLDRTAGGGCPHAVPGRRTCYDYYSLTVAGLPWRTAIFMRIRRRLPILFGVVLVAAAVALVVVLRKHAPPEPARLLPGADGYFYVNLKWVRRADIAGQLPEVPHEAEYQQFIQATGFQFERDLDQAAFAIHYPASKSGTTTGAKPAAPEPPRFSEIFVGRIEGERLRAYLGKISGSVENYRSADIYNIPLEGRTLRVAILGFDTVAASNHDDPMVIRGIIDRSRKLASPFGGPALLRRYFKYVPIASLGWAIFRVEPADGSPNRSMLSFLFNKPATVVASARYLGRVHFRAEAFTDSNDEAQRLTEQLDTFLQLFHAAEGTVSTPGNDPDVKAFFDGLKVQQHENRTVLTAAIPPGFIRKAVAAPPSEMVPETPPSVPPAAKSQSK